MGFTNDHEILTSKGWVKINDINTDYEAAVLQSDGSFAYKPVIDVKSIEVSSAPIVNIISDLVDLGITVDHPLYISQVTPKETKIEVPEEITPTESGIEEISEEETKEEETKEEAKEEEAPKSIVFRNSAFLNVELYDQDKVNESINFIIENNRIPQDFLLHFNQEQSMYLISLLFKDSLTVLTESRDFADDVSIIALNAGLACLVSPNNITVTKTLEPITEEDDENSSSASTTSIEEAPVEEAPVEETPVEEAPVEEAPVEEAPVEEAPISSDDGKTYVMVNILNKVAQVLGSDINQDEYTGSIYSVSTDSELNLLYVRRNGKAVFVYGNLVSIPEVNSDVELNISSDVSETPDNIQE